MILDRQAAVAQAGKWQFDPDVRLETAFPPCRAEAKMVRGHRQRGEAPPPRSRPKVKGRTGTKHIEADSEISYAFLGRHLGGRPGPVHLYDRDGRVDYERVRATALFQQGLDLLCQALEQFTVAKLCSEEDPLDCHRGLMIAPALVDRGIKPAHLRGDGSIESMAEFEDRLLRETGVGSGIVDGLFATTISDKERGELLADAYRRQARRRAYQLRPSNVEFSASAENETSPVE
jgi:hypothetical protein